MLRILSIALLLCTPIVAKADKIDDYVQQQMEQLNVPGLSLLVMERDGAARLRTYGLANLEHQVPVRRDTVFQSGSVGKQITAAAILLLVEDGRLALEDTLAKHFPEAPDSWKKVTIRHLLSHTSGLKDAEADGNDMPARVEFSDDEIVSMLMSFPLEFEPGSHWSYSNSGYGLLGILISKITSEHWSVFIERRIFDPIGMEHAQLVSARSIIPNRADGYVVSEAGEIRNPPTLSNTLLTSAAGGLYLSIEDLAAWETALRSEEFLDQSSVDLWWRPTQLTDGSVTDYGFGWFIRQRNGKKIIEHGGSFLGFKAHIARFVDTGLTVAFLANGRNMTTETFAHDIADIVREELRP